MTPAAPLDAAKWQLQEVVFPFWLQGGIDEEFGAFFTCFDNRGTKLVSTDKFTWSQGRFVWLLSRGAKLARRGLLDVDASTFVDLATSGGRFLLEHAVLDDSTTRFVVGRDGGPPENKDQAPRSVYADWFVVMGLSELASATGDSAWLDAAWPILERSRRDHLAGTAPTPPYAVPDGHEAYGPRMILVNTLLVVAQAAESLGRRGPERQWLVEALDAMLGHRLDDATFTEMPGPDPSSLVTRHRVPGHAIEGIWVALEALDLLGDERPREPLLDSLAATCELGWDIERGGLLRYCDATGPTAPTGKDSGTAYERLVRDTWSTKLWWVHSEASATTAIAAYRYRDARAIEWFRRIWEYTLTTFPAGDDGEEWIQIRDRDGEPLDQVVALPVKDPFHISRNLMQIVELTDTKLDRGTDPRSRRDHPPISG